MKIIIKKAKRKGKLKGSWRFNKLWRYYQDTAKEKREHSLYKYV
jgi:hypothetical protein